MDLVTLFTTLGSSGIISIAAAKWLTQRLIDHRFAKELKDYQLRLDTNLASSKAAFDEHINDAKARLEAELRQGVDEYLGEQAARREYRLDAQKRLYTVVGPLRFQLVIACSDLANRINRIGAGKQPYPISLTKGYFGRSTVFRLLRVFTVLELIERQIAYADFSVDSATGDLLRFKRAAFRCLSSSTITIDHPKANWDKQVEHVFHDTLSLVSGALVVVDPDSKQERAMRFDEFTRFIGDETRRAALDPIPELMEAFTPSTKPILWLRLVALARICDEVIEQQGQQLGFEHEAFDAMTLLSASSDDFIAKHHEQYKQMIADVVDSMHSKTSKSSETR